LIVKENVTMSAKRASVVLVSLMVALAVAACSAATPAPSPEPTQPPAQAPTAAPTQAASATPAGVTPAGVTPAGQTVFTMGDIGSDPAVIIDGTQPIADYIAKKLGKFGITKGQVKVAKDADEMTRWLKDGQVDLYFDSVYPAALISDASGAKPFIRRWKGGVEEYHTVIFAAKSSGITQVDQLNGHVIGFDNEYSTSGYVLPLAYLTEAGLTLVQKQSFSDTVGADEVGYTFSQADQNTIQWVVSGKLAAAATDNVTYDKLPDDVKSQLVIVAETEALPRQVGVIRPGIPDDLKNALVQVLINAGSDPDAAAALKSFQGTTKFDEFPQGIDQALTRIHQLEDIVKSAKK
jgi:phosphate/phosphite/phosphonate ABC transporter binding protein